MDTKIFYIKTLCNFYFIPWLSDTVFVYLCYSHLNVSISVFIIFITLIKYTLCNTIYNNH